MQPNDNAWQPNQPQPSDDKIDNATPATDNQTNSSSSTEGEISLHPEDNPPAQPAQQPAGPAAWNMNEDVPNPGETVAPTPSSTPAEPPAAVSPPIAPAAVTPQPNPQPSTVPVANPPTMFEVVSAPPIPVIGSSAGITPPLPPPAPRPPQPPVQPSAPQQDDPWHGRQAAAFMRIDAPVDTSNNQAVPPQPQSALPPEYAAASAQSYINSFGQAPPPKKRSGPMMLLIIVLVLSVLAVGGAIAYSKLVPKATPTQAFNTAIVNALSTSNVEQTNKTSTSSFDIKYDLSDVKNPKTSTAVTISSDNSVIAKLEGYGTLHNTYAKITQIPNVDTKQLNKWIQLRKDDNMPSDVSVLDTLYPSYDPRYAVLGEFIFGNFSANDQKTLAQYISTNQVYKYDPNAVTKTTIGSTPVYKYDVTLQHIDTLNQKAAKIFGITDTDAIDLSSSQVNGTKATMYVTVASKQLVKVTTSDTTVEYSKYGKTKLPAEPKADVQYEAYAAQLAGLDGSSGDATGSGPTTAPDVQREATIKSLQTNLEAYYALNGNYPTLTQLNDSTWVRDNLADFDASSLKDPAGTLAVLAPTPTVNQYSYQVGTDTKLTSCASEPNSCQHYVLTAKLSDGSTYQQTSLN